MLACRSIEAPETPMRLMPSYFDIVLESPRRQPVLLVECGGPRFTPEDAAYFRQNLSEVWCLDGPYFMLALRDDLYLWKKETPVSALPDFCSRAAWIWRQYLGDLSEQPDGPSKLGIQFVISDWLYDLAWGIRKPDPSSEPDQMLVM